MPSLNTVILAGNLTRDVELRYTAGGTAVGQFGLAVNRKWKDREGKLQDEVCFVEVTAWGKQAENAAKYMGKGKPVLIQGHLKLDQWTDKQSNQPRSKLKVVVEQLQFLGSGDQNQQQNPRPQQTRQPAPRQVDELPADDNPDNVPF